jgi:hypothetical protein
VILRRRALLVGTALTATGVAGCPPEQPAETPPTVVDLGPGRDMPEPQGRRLDPEPADENDDMPPLDVPEEAGGMARKNYEGLARVVPRLHAQLKVINDTMPTCNLDDAKCMNTWDVLIRQLRSVDTMIENLLPLCPGSSPEAQRYLERAKQHHKFAQKRRAETQQRIDRALSQNGGYAGKLVQLKIEAYRATARPCLSCIRW